MVVGDQDGCGPDASPSPEAPTSLCPQCMRVRCPCTYGTPASPLRPSPSKSCRTPSSLFRSSQLPVLPTSRRVPPLLTDVSSPAQEVLRRRAPRGFCPGACSRTACCLSRALALGWVHSSGPRGESCRTHQQQRCKGELFAAQQCVRNRRPLGLFWNYGPTVTHSVRHHSYSAWSSLWCYTR